MSGNKDDFVWKFHRIGGLDQVTLRSADELCHLGRLDPKLWVALSCPAFGLEFNQRALTLIDDDKDGRIRIPEVVAAVEWTCARLNDPTSIIDPPESMPLSVIRADSDEGRRLLASAEAVLSGLGKSGARELALDDVSQAAATASQNLFNGDGVLPAHEKLEADIRQFILDGLSVVGGAADASGQPGLNRELAETFIKLLEKWRDWKLKVCDAASPLGDDTPEGGELINRLRDKINDYFLRCDLAAFAPQSLESLNTDDSLAQALEKGLVNMEYLAQLPLAHIDGDRPLNLSGGLNPAWRKDLLRFFQLTSPLRAQAELLTREEWRSLTENFAAYAGALAGKPSASNIEATYPPGGTIEELSGQRINEILQSEVAARFQALLDRDQAAPGASTEVAALERLVYYHRHLYRFLMNFTSFYDFYSDHEAMFQTGTLYIDSRGCQLCLPVDQVAAHSVLAAFSQLCLVYCQCRRRQKSSQNLPEETINIVAAITAGQSDLLMEGRNGVYVDNQGHDWDATIIKLINNPIDLRQAVWEPYKKIGRFISEQISKFTGSQDDKLLNAATEKISGLASGLATPTAPKPAGGAPFDIGKSVGIFAAIGLALGALGTAVASIARAVFALSWYEIPLIFVALFLIISGPSVVLAWLKLRKRSIGPLLEASGWAINSRVPINISLGHKLTDTAILPENATRSFNDPLKPARKWTWVLLVILALALGSAIGWFWFQPDLWPGDLSGADSPAPVAAPAEPNQGG